MKDLWWPFSHQAQRFSPDDPHERCGFLMSRRYNAPISMLETHNVSPYPWMKFVIASRDYNRVKDSYTLKPGVRGVVGVWHTHPGRDRETWFPSASDLAGAARHPELIHVLYHPFTRRLTVFSARGITESFHLPPRWIYRRGTP